ncbi:MAG: hypothetical protein KGY53_11855 [Wenzhouxiangellaceae bacterium]|nr:hypothetical protein [Wenzhouxiangellaceae bacterium]
MSTLQQHMADDLAAGAPDGLAPLIARIRARCGPALRAVVLYGSTRRSANVHDGLVDLMAIVDDYRAVHGIGLTAMLNHLLPPNVYYLEAGADDERVRCKFIIVSERNFHTRTGGGLDGYFWARFTQPCRLVWNADEAAADFVTECRARAAAHFATEAVRLGDGEIGARDFWIRAISATYGCELRPEPPGAARALIARDPHFWDRLSEALLPELPGLTATGDRTWRVAIPARRRLVGRLRWTLRRGWSKALNLARLLKAAGTFANGVDYLSWKLERHSGIKVEVTDAMRRHPRLASWKLLIRMWRNGALG